MKTNKSYHKFFEGLRVACLVFALLLSVGTISAVANGIANDNMEQVMENTPLAFLSLATAGVSARGIDARSIRKSMSAAGFLTSTAQFLLEVLEKTNKVDQNTAANYRAGKLRMVNADFYIAKLISDLSGIQLIMDETTTKQTGVCNIDKGKLPKGVNAAIDRIFIGYDTDASITDVKELNNWDSVVSSWPAGLVNGHLHVKVDGQLVSDPIPMELCGSMADSTAGRGKYEGYSLNTPIFLPEDQQITLEVDLPEASFASNEHAIKVWLLGSKTKNKSGY
jgi:hypothetical protein